MIKKTIIYVSTITLLLALFISITNSPKLFFDNITNTLYVWLFYVYPSIFTFYLLANLLINLNLIRKVSFIFKPIIYFETQKAYELFIISMIVGNPSLSSLTIKELESHNITENDANKLIKVCSFFNPLFIISLFTVGTITNVNYAYLIIIIIFITNILTSYFFKHKKIKTAKNNDIILINPEKILSSINDCLYLLIQIAGIMVFINIIKFSLLSFFEYLNIKSFIIDFIICNMEISTGAVNVLQLNYQLEIKLGLLTFLINFQGLSINLQVYNVVKKYQKLFPIIFIRLIQASFSTLLIYLYFIIK